MSESSERCLAYLRARAGVCVPASELQGVAGRGVPLERVAKEIAEGLRGVEGVELEKFTMLRREVRRWEVHYRLRVDAFRRGERVRREKQLELMQ